MLVAMVLKPMLMVMNVARSMTSKLGGEPLCTLTKKCAMTTNLSLIGISKIKMKIILILTFRFGGRLVA